MRKIVALNSICVDVFEELGEIHLGGEALNFCGNACEKEDVACYLMGAIGTDRFGQVIMEKIKEYPINREYLKMVEGITANNRIYLTEDGERYFHDDSWTSGVYGTYHMDEKDMMFLRNADVVHTTLFSLARNQVIEVRKKNDFLLSIDFNTERSFDEWEELLPWIDVFFISGSEDIFGILQEWSEKYDTVFVATLAERGSIAFAKGTEYRCEAESVKNIIDTTGAGDSYQAGFMVSYCKERDIRAAMKAGSLQAAKTLKHLGGF